MWDHLGSPPGLWSAPGSELGSAGCLCSSEAPFGACPPSPQQSFWNRNNSWSPVSGRAPASFQCCRGFLWIRRSFRRREAKRGGSEAPGQGKALRGHPSSLPGLLREPREEPRAGNAAAERFLMGAGAGMGAETAPGALSCRGVPWKGLCQILLGAGEFLEEKALEWCCLAVHPCRWTVASPAAREGPFIPPPSNEPKKTRDPSSG